jgi:hypothetical protein
MYQLWIELILSKIMADIIRLGDTAQTVRLTELPPDPVASQVVPLLRPHQCTRIYPP